MLITFFCEKCGQRYQVDQGLAGKRTKCKKCQNVLVIPGPAGSARAEARVLVAEPIVARPVRQRKREEPDFIDEREQPEFLPEHATSQPRREFPGGQPVRPTGGLLSDPTTRYAVIGVGATLGVLLLVLLVVAVSRAGRSSAPVAVPIAAKSSYSDHEAAVKEEIALLTTLNDQLWGIRDERAARAHAPAVKESVQRLVELRRKVNSLPPLTATDRGRLRAGFEFRASASRRVLQEQVQRLRRLPGVPEALEDATQIAIASA
jgi:hypothetical protein